MLNMKSYAPQKFPTREQLRRRFTIKLGSGYEIFKPVISLLSEETEKIILELWAKAEPVPEKAEKESTVHLRKHEKRIHAYYCLNCKTKKINTSHRFCPHCGFKIVWNQVASLKEFNRQIKKTA